MVETRIDEVRRAWEERFERRYGCWRGSIDKAVNAFLDCGILNHGFARMR